MSKQDKHDSYTFDAYISIFTPSQTNVKDLEAIFVQREALLTDAIERVAESAKTKNKHHQLMVGSRGSGKTHLVTLLVHRLKQTESLENILRIAWLNEDETFVSFLDILRKIFESLQKRYPEEFTLSEIDTIFDMKPNDAQVFLGDLLAEKLKKAEQTCLVVIENLDAMFDAIGKQGQEQLRAYIQENPHFTFFTTAQKLTKELKDRKNPFFGFFQTEYLEALSEAEAAELISNIAKLHHKSDVSDFLKTHQGKMRIKALHHLSGGNHRMYIVLSQFISRDTIDDLVKPFIKMVDELTPYYQERVRWLPPLQRKIIELLSASRSTLSVKRIARQLFSSNQSIASQLKDLKDKGYVRSHKRGRESLYEITEPLMRICVEVKENQDNKPIAILVDFIRAWYDSQDIKNKLDGKTSKLGECYLKAALEKGCLIDELMKQENKTTKNRVEESREDADVSIQKLTVKINNKNITVAEKAKALLDRATLFYYQANLVAAIKDCTQVIQLQDAPTDQVAHALFNRGVTYGEQGEIKKELSDYTRVIELADASVDQVARALINRGITYGQQEEIKKELSDYTRVIELADAPIELVAEALFNRGVTYGQQGEIKKKLSDYNRVIELKDAPVDQVARALFNRGVAYKKQGEIKKALSDYTRAIELADAPVDQVAKALINRGVTYGEQGEIEKALSDCTRVIELPDAPVDQVAKALINRGVAYDKKNEYEKALSDYSKVIKLSKHLAKDNAVQFLKAYVFSAEAFIKLGQWQKAMKMLSKGIFLGKQSKELKEYNARDIIDAVFKQNMDTNLRICRVKELVLCFNQNKTAMDSLGVGLISHLGVLNNKDPKPLNDNLNSWLEAWDLALKPFEEMSVTRRLFAVGIDYLKSADKKKERNKELLLDLIETERSVLEQVFDL
jgi:tetratricopeptide (TPR) repeat protein